MKRYYAWVAVVFLAMFSGTVLAADYCEVCGKLIDGTMYVWEDKVANVSRKVCSACIKLPKSCFMCSLPVAHDYTELPDGRVLCARDAKTVVLTEDEALKICDEVRESMDRLFSRFVSFPETNVSISLADRVSLINLFNIPGRDYSCPNVMGYIQSRTNNNHVTHEMSLMSGLPRSTLKSTFAHECTHAWVAENVPVKRRSSMVRDTEEGFCELVSYMVMNSLGDEEAKKAIKLNGYTRGQIDLFLEAENRFGFNDVVDWMKYGVDDRLVEGEIGRVREVEMPVAVPSPTNTNTVTTLVRPVEQPAPSTLSLQGITWSSRPVAMINNCDFQLQEQRAVRVGTNTFAVRCLAIREDSVLIQNMSTGEKLELKLKPAGKK